MHVDGEPAVLNNPSKCKINFDNRETYWIYGHIKCLFIEDWTSIVDLLYNEREWLI